MYFADQMSKGDFVLLDNETIMLKVEMISATTLTCKIERGGFLGSYKDVFVPNVVFDMPNFTDRDKSDVELLIKNQVKNLYLNSELVVCITFYKKILTINYFYCRLI